MRRALRPVLALAAVGLGLAACGSAQTRTPGSSAATAAGTASRPTVPGASGGLAVSPGRGGPRTIFTLAFTAPASTERVGEARTGYTVAVTGGTGPVATGGTVGSCAGPRSMAIGATTRGLPVSVSLDPTRLGGAWCAGVHAARVIEIETPVCDPGTMCPQYVRVIGTVGVARFTVGP